MTDFDAYLNKLLKQLPWHKRMWIRVKCFSLTFWGHYFNRLEFNKHLIDWLDKQPLKVKLLFANHVKKGKNESF